MFSQRIPKILEIWTIVRPVLVWIVLDCMIDRSSLSFSTTLVVGRGSAGKPDNSWISQHFQGPPLGHLELLELVRESSRSRMCRKNQYKRHVPLRTLTSNSKDMP